MKKLISILMMILLAISTFGACKKPSAVTGETEPTWGSFTKNAYGYVYELYNFDVPTVTDSAGKELTVHVSVHDAQGKELDTTGGFFVMREAADYTITYSVTSNGKTYTNNATVTGIMKTDYTLKSLALYEVGELVDLTGVVSATEGGDVTYLVKYENESIELNENKFTATKAGIYEVTAMVEKQPNYQFELTVIEDKSQYTDPNGLITDRADTSAFVQPTFAYIDDPDFERTSTYNMSVTDETYDGKDGESTLFTISYPDDSDSFALDITYKPEFPLEYYKMLLNSGYDKIAVRMKVSHDNYRANWGLFPFKWDTSMLSVAMYDKAGNRIVNKPSTYALWPYEIASANGEWFEMILPLGQFINHYKAEGMVLFEYVTYRTFMNDGVTYQPNFGNIKIWIDNVYAVKPITDEALTTFYQKELNATFDVYAALGHTEEVDVDTVYGEYRCYGENIQLSTDGKITLDKQGIYSFSMRKKNRYGVAATKVATIDVETLVSDRGDTSAFSYDIVYSGNGTETATVEFTYDNVEKFDVHSNGSVKATITRPNGTKQFDARLYFTPEFTKDYYIELKEKGYNYVSFRYKIQQTVTDINLSSCKFVTFAHQIAYTDAQQTQKVIEKNSQGLGSGIGWGASTYGWFEMRVPIDTFLTYFGERILLQVKVTSGYGNVQLWIDGVYAVKIDKTN